MKYLKTFEKYSTPEEIAKEPTFRDNGQHIWDRNDTIISIYYFKMRENHTTFDDININSSGSVDVDNLERDLLNSIGLDSAELAEYIIGCSEGALIMNSKVVEHLVTGRETGMKNPNHFQVEIANEMVDYDLEKLTPLVEVIIDEIENDENRLNDNKKAKSIREELKEINKTRKIKLNKLAEEEDRKSIELERDLKSSSIKNGSSITNLDSAIVELGSIINHPKFGIGEVISVGGKVSSVKFDNEVKKMANVYLLKFLQ